MTVKEISQVLEVWAPKELAWERDNVGLQIGDEKRRVKKILLSLDCSKRVIEEAKKKEIDLIICHHPLFFHPLKSVQKQTRTGAMVVELAKREIAVYSAHTNLDVTTNGVSVALAETIGLQNINVLLSQKDMQKKIVVFVPHQYVDKVTKAMAEAGAGVIGNYEYCSFQLEGTGTFRGTMLANPFVGKTGTLEKVQEVRLEMIVPNGKVRTVLNAMKSVHPYEEVAYDVYPLSNETSQYGAGAIGEFKRPMTVASFIGTIKRKLHTRAIRCSSNPPAKIKRVAVCGGSGSDLLSEAIRQQADAFVTADVRYHTFQEAENVIALIDAGHFETEFPILKKLASYLQKEFNVRKERIVVLISQQQQNPVLYH
jgi:dinuclear metal center YbgI/SA1388 family protein